jgi:hypothetical protein
MADKLTPEQIALLEKLNALEEEANKKLTEKLGKKRRVLTATEEALALAQAQQELVEKIAEAEREKLAELRDQLDIATKLGEASKDQLKTLIKQIEVQKGVADSSKAAADGQRSANDALAQGLEGMSKIDNAAKSIAQRWFGINDSADDFVSLMIEAKEETGAWGSAFKDVLNTIGKQMTPQRSLKALLQKSMESASALAMGVFDVAKSFDQQVVNFRRATGAGAEYSEIIRTTADANRDLGVSFADAGVAAQSLYQGSKAFASLAKADKAALIGFASVMEKGGVQAATFAKTFDILNKNLGMNRKQAQSTSREMRKLAVTLGKDVNEVFEDFNEFAAKSSQLGDKLIDSFRNLEIQAKQTGTSVNELAGIAEKFKTFDSAANIVGDLNAILGGPFINTLDMVANAYDKPEKVISNLQNALKASGKSWQGLTAAMRESIAESTGMDMNLANRVYGNMEDLETARKNVEENMGMMERMEHSLANNVSFQEKFNLLMEELASENMAEIMEMAKSFLEFLGGIAKTLNKLGAVKFVVGFALLLKVLAPVVGIMGNVVGMLTGWGAAAKKATMDMNNLGNAGQAAGEKTNAGANKASMGMSKLRMGIGLAATAAGMLMKSFAEGMEDGGMKTTLEYGGAALTGAGMGMMIGGPVGAVVGGLGGLLWHHIQEAKKELDATRIQLAPGEADKIIEEVKSYQTGVTNFEGGLAKVHGGEMLVNMPSGTNVITNENAQKISAASSDTARHQAAAMAEQTRMMRAMQNGKGTSVKVSPMPISVQIGDREIKKIMYEFMEENVNIAT